MKSILFPFVHETDFSTGYAWSLELASRIKGHLSIFTTIPDGTREHYSLVYESLIKARQFHLRRLGTLTLGKRPPSVTRNFLKGDFENTFVQFVVDTKFDVIVLPSEIVSDKTLKQLIHAHKQIICLPSDGLPSDGVDMKQPAPTREAFFLEMLQRTACYNLPTSFFRLFGDDKSLFNSIASFFLRPESDITKLLHSQ